VASVSGDVSRVAVSARSGPARRTTASTRSTNGTTRIETGSRIGSMIARVVVIPPASWTPAN